MLGRVWKLYKPRRDTWGSLQSSLQAESLSLSEEGHTRERGQHTQRPRDSQMEHSVFRDVGVALHSWGMEFGV